MVQPGTPAQWSQLDGRYGPTDPEQLRVAVRDLAAMIDTTEVDCVLGFPEGGLVPAFAFAHIVGRPFVLSTRLRLPLSPVIRFDEPHSTVGKTHHVHGLRDGDRVVIIEDEITTGGTVINAVRALRHAGIRVSAVGALLAVDDPRMWRSMEEERIALHARLRLPPERAAEHAARLGKPRP